MKNYIMKTIEEEELGSLTCDSCLSVYDDVLEMQEFLQFSSVGGYGSVFGDGKGVEGDFCQHCVKKLLGDHLRIYNYE